MALVLKSICFNHNGDPTLGSLHCRKDYNTTIDSVARLQDGQICPVGVFVPRSLGLTISVRIEIENTGDLAVNATVSAFETSRTPLFGDVTFPGTVCPPHAITAINGIITTATLKALPIGIQIFKQNWEWIYQTIGGIAETELTQTVQTVYLLPHLPLLPWDVTVQPYFLYETNYIWTSLLDICYEACMQYQSILGHLPANDIEFASAFTHELNQNPAFRYDTLSGASFYTGINNDSYRTIKLQKYVVERKQLYNKLNCTDCATIVQIEALACGVNVSGVRMMSNVVPNAGFDCNPIHAIGYNKWDYPFNVGGHGGFSYHEVASLDAVRNNTTSIFDACLKMDGGDNPSTLIAPPPKLSQQVLNVPFAETAVDVVVMVPPYIVNFYRERLVVGGQNCNILPTVIRIKYIDNSLKLQTEQMMEDADDFYYMKKIYGLEENPLPKAGMYREWNKPEFLSKEPLNSHCRMTENYGRNKVYNIELEGSSYRLEMTFALNENEAYVILLSSLAEISNPYLQRAPIGDISFSIQNKFYLFVKNNVVVRVETTDEASQTSAEELAQMICKSL